MTDHAEREQAAFDPSLFLKHEGLIGQIIRQSCDPAHAVTYPGFVLKCSVGALAQRIARALGEEEVAPPSVRVTTARDEMSEAEARLQAVRDDVRRSLESHYWPSETNVCDKDAEAKLAYARRNAAFDMQAYEAAVLASARARVEELRAHLANILGTWDAMDAAPSEADGGETPEVWRKRFEERLAAARAITEGA